MKNIGQLFIILLISFAGELLNTLLPLPIPASVYGLILMLIALLTGWLRPEQIETTADFLIAIMPVLFVAPTMALVAQLERFATLGIPILLVGILGTTLVIGLSGRAAQEVGKREAKKRGEGQKHE